MKRVCVVTDNEFLCNELEMIRKQKCPEYYFDYFYSFNNRSPWHPTSYQIKPICLKNQDDSFFSNYDLFLSIHCKQIFPEIMVNNYRCINVHPGLNPNNRGWFPQVFSIINKKPVGVTIHEMDNLLDHGPIIYSQRVEINNHETSEDVYKKITQTEIVLLKENLKDLVDGNYHKTPMSTEGNINYKSDFIDLCKLDLNATMKVGEVIDILRATSFGGYDNAFFTDSQGRKIYVSISLKLDDSKKSSDSSDSVKG